VVVGVGGVDRVVAAAAVDRGGLAADVELVLRVRAGVAAAGRGGHDLDAATSSPSPEKPSSAPSRASGRSGRGPRADGAVVAVERVVAVAAVDDVGLDARAGVAADLVGAGAAEDGVAAGVALDVVVAVAAVDRVVAAAAETPSLPGRRAASRRRPRRRR
jgi:hypothetical protein